MCARGVLYAFLLEGLCLVLCKKFESRCAMAKQITELDVPIEVFIGQWVCLIEQVSNRDTSKVTISGGRKSYGLYQIPSRWCKEGKKGGECNIACESLLDDDIYDDTVCAVHIFNREGFKYWPIWVTRCKNKVDAITADIFKCPGISMRMGIEEETYSSSKSRQKRFFEELQSAIPYLKV